ncbi:hypothetical protein GCM10010168_70050 [Actinoplanes ianthinogenes]|uniref:Uncharacterized protein n=1 Tax=Actinoplanes ianthinogenes TaxID=122358 RepID=A0ABN6CJP8_9ACTN|nr:hypothetical protein [Actinoplanes ianthinogenes]BCJ45204.1 hypothetical protein Aiant_58610 [Actinoplanes ianthinogenes]GGR41263.1 hypothetical protein GCM10010168_70050 [Actinoplanes ianthinogenes]
MSTAGPNRLDRRLSTCEVGDVWSGADAQGRPMTVAQLNELASADDRWRSAFRAASEALGAAEDDGLPIAGSDHDAERPWVACPEVPGSGGAAEIFTVLGQQLRPAFAGETALSVRTEPDPPTVPFQPVTPGSVAAAQPTATHPVPIQPVATHPVAAHPVSAQPISGHPVSGRPLSGRPTSGPPTSGLPSFGNPISVVPISGGSPAYRQSGVGPRPDRLLLLIVALVSLLVGAAIGAAVVTVGSDGDKASPQPSSAPVTYTDAQLLLPATPPARPGLDPAPDGTWPDDWPKFPWGKPEVQDVTGLPGLGFDFRMPTGWTCELAEKAEAAVHYRCGLWEGTTLTAGGDLTVRTCVAVCDDTARTALRQREEAWGLRWTSGTSLRSWADTAELDGQAVYGLVYVGFWRTVPEGVLDREVVLRMTAPVAAADDVKKVADSIRDRTYSQ